MSVYYRVTAYNRVDLDELSRENDEATVIHYDAMPANVRVESPTIKEEKNAIPSFTFTIYPDNPGYDKLIEFDTLLGVEEYTDAPATDYLGDCIVWLELIDGTTDEYILHARIDSLAECEAIDRNEYLAIFPRLAHTTELTNAAGIIIEDEWIAHFEAYTDTTKPTGTTLSEWRVVDISTVLAQGGLVYRDVTCEGALGFLHDSIQPYLEEQVWPDTDESTGLYKYMSHLLDVHNAQVEPYKRIYIGVCDTNTHLTNDQVSKGTNWDDTWSIIDSKLIDVFGGEIKIQRSLIDGLNYLYYTNKMSELSVITKPVQPIKLHLNVKNGEVAPVVNQVITRLYPLGAKLEDKDGGESEERLTIEKVNPTGQMYIEDEMLKRIYGIVPATNTWDDVTIADNLYSKAVDWLAENNNYPVSVSLSAYDLSVLGYEFERLELYNDIPVTIEPLGTQEFTDGGVLEVVQRTLYLDRPWESSIELGDTNYTASRQYARLVNAIKELTQ